MTERSLTMLADAPLTEMERRRSLVAVIACISVAGMGLGLSIPLLALMMERNGVPASLIGLNTAVPALATFLMTRMSAAITANGARPSVPTRKRSTGPEAKPHDRTVPYKPISRPRFLSSASMFTQNSLTTNRPVSASPFTKRMKNQSQIFGK